MWGVVVVILLATVGFAAVGFFAGVAWHTLADALLRSTYRLILAYGIAVFFGAAIALSVGAGRLSNYVFPIFDVLQNIPSFALIPLFIYFFGFTDTMIVVFAATSIIWPILFSVLTAIRTAPMDLVDAATVFGATGIKRTIHFHFPLSVPALITGSIVGIAIGWEAVIGAEIIGNAGGFGAFITNASTGGVSPAVIAGIVGLLVIVFVMNRLIWSPLLSESAHRYAE